APVAGLTVAFLGLALAQQVHRDAFEANEPGWVRGPADAPFREVTHAMTEEHAHGGQRSETIQIEAQAGNFVPDYYHTGRAPIGQELTASLWVRATRPGVQLLARLVLPRERNPQRPDEPLAALLRGDQYEQASRWQRLEVRRPVKLLQEQRQLLRA